MHLSMFEHHATLPPPPRVKPQHREGSEGASLLAALPRFLSRGLGAGAWQQQSKAPAEREGSEIRPVTFDTLPTTCLRGECRRRPSYDESFSGDMHSPRPHERPSGYRAWYVLGLGKSDKSG
mmetsp:Transcript_27795/g.70009  ORF Transcript_27795/g.70009 Transcript_27795/m.70009 type:complete len:122 (-) Transcript_27795:128-493(-)